MRSAGDPRLERIDGNQLRIVFHLKDASVAGTATYDVSGSSGVPEMKAVEYSDDFYKGSTHISVCYGNNSIFQIHFLRGGLSFICDEVIAEFDGTLDTSSNDVSTAPALAQSLVFHHSASMTATSGEACAFHNHPNRESRCGCRRRGQDVHQCNQG